MSNLFLNVSLSTKGYFRVHYDDNLATLIKQQLERDNSMISPLTRSQLLDDYFNFATEGVNKEKSWNYAQINNFIMYLL